MGGGLLATSTVVWFQFGGRLGALVSLALCALTGGLWWADIRREGTSGELSPLAVDGLQLGILWFLFRELCFFGAFFWSFFHLALSPAVEVGNT
jgi:heme/copper-type cytochrome/quinol oxidase subunit 3